MIATLVRGHSQLLPGWRWKSVSCSILQARLAATSGNKAGATQFAQQAIRAARSIRTGDAATDGIWLATVYRQAGDVAQGAGDPGAATAAWAHALAAFPARVAETPAEMSEHAMVLQRAGRAAEANGLVRKLRAMGFHDPEFRAK